VKTLQYSASGIVLLITGVALGRLPENASRTLIVRNPQAKALLIDHPQKFLEMAQDRFINQQASAFDNVAASSSNIIMNGKLWNQMQ
jgi:ABC-type cobalamin transport system ATPase subunit